MATLHSKEGSVVGGGCVVVDASVVEGGLVVAFIVV